MSKSLLLALSALGIGTLGGLSEDLLDDTDGNGLFHVTDGEAAERGVLGEFFDDHGLLGHELNHGGITGLDARRVLLSDFTSTFVNLGLDGIELASDVGGVAIEHW